MQLVYSSLLVRCSEFDSLIKEINTMLLSLLILDTVLCASPIEMDYVFHRWFTLLCFTLFSCKKMTSPELLNFSLPKICAANIGFSFALFVFGPKSVLHTS